MKRTAGSCVGARRKAGAPVFAVCGLVGLIVGLIGASGCLSDRVGSIIETAPRIDPLLSYEEHYASAGQPFSLDLGHYLSDDQDEPWQLVCEVVAGGGSFDGQVYQNTFMTAGVHYVIVSVTDSTSNVTESYFSVNVPFPFPAGTVFVSPTGSDNTGDGSMESPCRTITKGIAVAGGAGASQVAVACGVYDETVTLPDGVSVLGGYNTSFTARDLAGLRAMIVPPAGSLCTVLAQNVTATTAFQGFVVQGPMVSETGKSSVGVKAVDCGSLLEICDNLIYAGRGGDGARGADGADGRIGVDGATGGDAVPDTTGPNPNPGGKGGVFTDGLYPVDGGDGGSADDPVYDMMETPGMPGKAAAGVTPGAGGDPGHASKFVAGPALQDPTSPNPKDGSPGIEGGRGVDGGGGAGGSGEGVCESTVDGDWIGPVGGAGPGGLPGGGGGGGGAGGGAEDPLGVMAPSYNFIIGASGGGGGSGGGAGTGGVGGTSGGGSFGVFVHFTGMATPSSFPVITGNEIRCGVGGSGGSGGKGGAGAAGGSGGAGGIGVYDTWSTGDAGAGGSGGEGGHAGGGGGGAGGLSAGVLVNALGGAAPTAEYASGNVIDTATGRGGLGGAGGASAGNDGTPGEGGAVVDVKEL